MVFLTILSFIIVFLFLKILTNKQMVITRKALLYSLPASTLISLCIYGSLLYTYGALAPQLEVLLILIGISMFFIGVPIYLALSSEDKNKKWIIWLAALCFLPFGTILYFVSLIWAISAKITQVKNKKDGTKNKRYSKKIHKKDTWGEYIEKP